MRGLQTVAKALGPARTASELVPFLAGMSFVVIKLDLSTTPTDSAALVKPTIAEQVEDDDEVLMIMAEQLGGFVELMGGNAQAAVLVDILGSLATVEETIVRDKVSTCLSAFSLDSRELEYQLLCDNAG